MLCCGHEKSVCSSQRLGIRYLTTSSVATVEAAVCETSVVGVVVVIVVLASQYPLGCVSSKAVQQEGGGVIHVCLILDVKYIWKETAHII